MLDGLSPRLRHAALIALGAAVAIVTQVVAPAVVAKYPFVAPVVGAGVTLLAAELTKLQTQYGVGSNGEGDSAV